ncbi:hypothetical protein JCM6882_000033, partial [Rhodosporidiobolus microsporus]
MLRTRYPRSPATRLIAPAARRFVRSTPPPVHGYLPPPPYTLPDFTPSELSNRAKNASLLRLVESYRKHGHRAALLDPLDLAERPDVPALDPGRYGFVVENGKEGGFELRREFRSEARPAERVGGGGERYDVTGILDFPEGEAGKMKTMEEIAQRLAEVYCGGVAYEYMHLPSKHERRFLETLLERSHALPVPPHSQLAYYALLAKSEAFDRFLAKRFPNVKRYGLEGAEGMMVAVASLLDAAAGEGVKDAVIGMPHRGRLNLLTQLLSLDPRLVFLKMRGLSTLPASYPSSQFSDDVLSHLFLSSNYTPPSASSAAGSEGEGEDKAKSVRVHVLPNPSHLETVTPVALGFARGLQVPFSPAPPSSSSSAAAASTTHPLGTNLLSISIHGDAAFGGQGVVAESLNLASLPHFTVGGTVHLVVNNQIGYTTPAIQGRSSFYATDLAKMIAAPILHVNGDKIDDISRAMRLALAYQRKFKKDVVVDLVVYRRAGHNELDEPGFTQPIMYQKIRGLDSVASFYEQHLLSTSTLTPSAASSLKSAHLASLEAALAATDGFEVHEASEASAEGKANEGNEPWKRERGWEGMRWPTEGEWEKEGERMRTGVEEEVLREVGRRSVEVPEGITVHPRLLKHHISKRLQSLDKGEGIDFATAEALAFGSLLLEGYHVRLSGQDCGRGTFSQRHAILADQNSERVAVPLQSLTSNPPAEASSSTPPGTFEVVNSPLSEYAVLGFEQ